jgi:succinate dehydrogenase / fumarate reductase cytochrome b subunit
MARIDRPLSPHLAIYSWKISNTLSIVHRMTGVALSFGAVVLVGWLVSIVAGYDTYSVVNYLLSSIIGSLALFGWTFCFFYNLCNGIRHMCWDVGKGFDRLRAQQSGMLVLAVAILLTLGLWAVVLAG